MTAKWCLFIQASWHRSYYVRQRCDSLVPSDAQATSLLRSPRCVPTAGTRHSPVYPADEPPRSRLTEPRPSPQIHATVRSAASVLRRVEGRVAGTRGTRRQSACRRYSRGTARTTRTHDDVGERAALMVALVHRCRRCRKDEVLANDSRPASFVCWLRHSLSLLLVMMMMLLVPRWCYYRPDNIII